MEAVGKKSESSSWRPSSTNLWKHGPSLVTLSVLSVVSPVFRIGALIALPDVLSKFGISKLFRKCGIIDKLMKKGDPKKPAGTPEPEHPFVSGIAVPAIEEVVFRALLQPTIGLVGSACCYGAVHLTNPHAEAKIQAIFTTYSGLIYGALYARYGIMAPLAAHMVNNTVVRIVHDFFLGFATKYLQ